MRWFKSETVSSITDYNVHYIGFHVNFVYHWRANHFGLKQLPKNSGEHLFEVIMRRYENQFTIMTSNRPLEEWGKLLSDVPNAGAILDRFLHHAQRRRN
jgi:hypothetical protein